MLKEFPGKWYYIGMDLKIFSNHDHSLNAESFYTL